MVKRYEASDEYVTFIERKDGTFVYYDDYAALSEENKRLREALDRVRAALAAWEDAAPECVQDIRRALEEGSDGRYNQ